MLAFFAEWLTDESKLHLIPASAIGGGSYQRQPSYHLLIQNRQ